MEYNVYAPPAAAVAELAPAATALDEFYVVGKAKFVALFVATLGMYQVYWAYRHWRHYRRVHKEKMSPVVRAIFQIFFTHALTRSIDASLKASNRPAQWSPSVLASVFVVVQLVTAVLDRLAGNSIGSPTTDVLGLAMLLPMGLCMWAVQARANLACGDADGERNRRLTWANGLWIAAGGCLWLLALVGLLMSAGIIAE